MTMKTMMVRSLLLHFFRIESFSRLDFLERGEGSDVESVEGETLSKPKLTPLFFV